MIRGQSQMMNSKMEVTSLMNFRPVSLFITIIELY